MPPKLCIDGTESQKSNKGQGKRKIRTEIPKKGRQDVVADDEQRVKEGQGETQESQTDQEVTKDEIPPPAKRMRSKIKERDIPIQVKPKSSHLNLKQIVQRMRELEFHRDEGEPKTHAE